MSEAECSEDNFGPRRDSIFIVIPLTLVYLTIFVTGIVGNVSTCIVIAKNKCMHTATNYYLLNLAISDLLLLVMGLPQEVYFFWSRYPYIFGNTFCFLRGLFAETSGNAAVLTITAFTFERYLAICHPFLSHTVSKLSRAIKLIIIIWILSICLAVPQAIPLKVVGKCPHCFVTDPFINNSFEVSTFVFFVTPMTLIIVLYILIGVKLKTSKMKKKRISGNSRIQNHSTKKVVKMLVAVATAFFVCWAPFHIQRLYSIYQEPSPETLSWHLKMYEAVTYISGIFYYMSATINPILYNIMSVKFREAFKETFFHYLGVKKQSNVQKSCSVLFRSNIQGVDSLAEVPNQDQIVHTYCYESAPAYEDIRLQRNISLQITSRQNHMTKEKRAAFPNISCLTNVSTMLILEFMNGINGTSLLIFVITSNCIFEKSSHNENISEHSNVAIIN